MPRQHYSDLLALIAVARERSFTRAAADLGMSQSMLSHTIRQMEARLGVRLLTRTTRSVSVTEAGQKLLDVVSPRLKSIEAELENIAHRTDPLAGTVRITATDHAIDTLVWPKLVPILARNQQIKVELSVEYALSDLVQGKYDFGVRLGAEVAKDISAIRIGPDIRLAVVGAPSYLAARPPPEKPEDLVHHDCINLRLQSRNGLHEWVLKKGQRVMNAQVEGRLVFNGYYQLLNAAVAGFGLAYVPEDLARPYLDSGKLQPVLKSWWLKHPGYHLVYATQREATPAMQLLIEALRHRR